MSFFTIDHVEELKKNKQTKKANKLHFSNALPLQEEKQSFCSEQTVLCLGFTCNSTRRSTLWTVRYCYSPEASLGTEELEIFQQGTGKIKNSIIYCS